MSVNKMIAIVQMYIHHRKGVEVNIKIQSMNDIAKLTRAYNIAVDWFDNNGFRLVN